MFLLLARPSRTLRAAAGGAVLAEKSQQKSTPGPRPDPGRGPAGPVLVCIPRARITLLVHGDTAGDAFKRCPSQLVKQLLFLQGARVRASGQQAIDQEEHAGDRVEGDACVKVQDMPRRREHVGPAPPNKAHWWRGGPSKGSIGEGEVGK